MVVDDQAHPAQWKRNAILLAVKGIFGHGISPDDIAEIIEETGKRKLFKVVQEATKDPEHFITLAIAATTAEGGQYKDSRWHTDTGDLHDALTHLRTERHINISAWLRSLLARELARELGPDRHPAQGTSTWNR